MWQLVVFYLVVVVFFGVIECVVGFCEQIFDVYFGLWYVAYYVGVDGDYVIGIVLMWDCQCMYIIKYFLGDVMGIVEISVGQQQCKFFIVVVCCQVVVLVLYFVQGVGYVLQVVVVLNVVVQVVVFFEVIDIEYYQ